MTETGVRKVVARLVTDEKFKNEFQANPKDAIEKSGYSVSESEIAALEKIKAGDLQFNYNKTGAGTKGIEVGVTALKNFGKVAKGREEVIR